MFVEAVAAGGQTAQLQGIFQLGQVHPAAPVSHHQQQLVLGGTGGQSDENQALFPGEGGGDGIVAQFHDALVESHVLFGQPGKGVRGNVDLNGMEILMQFVHGKTPL